MNILSLNLFKVLRARFSKLKSLLKAKEEAKKGPEDEWGCIDIGDYTILDRLRGGKKCDLLTSVHMSSRQLDQARHWHKAGKARWDHNHNEQTYRPKEIKLDPQLEFNYDRLGLSKEMEQTSIGSTVK